MRREAHALELLRAKHPADLVLCAPVAAEIQFGLSRLVEGSRRRVLLEAEYLRLRAVLPWADWTESAAAAYGREKAKLEAAGEGIGDMDVIIASVALAVGAIVATANVKDFRRIRALVVEDWRAA